MRDGMPPDLLVAHGIIGLAFVAYWVGGTKTGFLMEAASKHFGYEWSARWDVYRRGTRAIVRHVAKQMAISLGAWGAFLLFGWCLSGEGREVGLWRYFTGVALGMWVPASVMAIEGWACTHYASRSRGLRGRVAYAAWYGLSVSCASYASYCVLWSALYVLVSHLLFAGAAVFCGLTALLQAPAVRRRKRTSTWASAEAAQEPVAQGEAGGT